MGTDIAFALGVVAVVGRRVPASLKLFLLTLATVDDIGAVVVIGFFYSAGLRPQFLLGAVVVVIAILLRNRTGVGGMLGHAALAGPCGSSPTHQESTPPSPESCSGC